MNKTLRIILIVHLSCLGSLRHRQLTARPYYAAGIILDAEKIIVTNCRQIVPKFQFPLLGS